MTDKYDRQGNSMDLMEWAAKMEDVEYKRVAQDVVGDTTVSTVWLGLNHNFGPGKPLIFETMVFGGEHSDWQDWYSTEAEAIAGHRRVVAAIQRGEAP